MKVLCGTCTFRKSIFTIPLSYSAAFNGKLHKSVITRFHFSMPISNIIEISQNTDNMYLLR